MTRNRGKGKAKVKNPASHSGIPTGTHTGKENIVSHTDDLWAMAYKMYPGEMDQMYREILSSTGQDIRSNKYGDSRDFTTMKDDPLSLKSLQLAMVLNRFAGSDFSKRLENGQVSASNKDDVNGLKLLNGLNDLFNLVIDSDGALRSEAKAKAKAKDINTASSSHTAAQ